MLITAENYKKTSEYAFFLGKILTGGEHLFLLGELGAGKTTFVQGLSKGLNTQNIVSSPTFTIMNIYNGRINMYHFDFYRLEKEEDLENIGFGEFFDDKNSICVIEWADKFINVNKEEGLILDFQRKNDLCQIKVQANGTKYLKLIEDWLKYVNISN